MGLLISKHQIIYSDTAIIDGLELMLEEGHSYLLLKNKEDVVTGIFTKTDLLELVVSSKGDISNLSRPFHQLMTKPLKTLPLSLVHTAPEFMTKGGFNHLPITEVNSSSGAEEIVGIVTSRSIFEFAVKMKGLPPIFGGQSIKKPMKTLGVLSPDGVSFQLLEKVFSRSQYISAQRYRFAKFDFKEVAEEVDALILDIDGIEKRIWFPIVEAAVKNPDLETVCVIFTEEEHEALADTLHSLEAMGFFKLYEKPLDVTMLISDLEKHWALGAVAKNLQ